MRFKLPNQKEKNKMYEDFIHLIALHAETGSKDLGTLINKACDWSYAHRVGNGELTEHQQNQRVAAKFWTLTKIN